MKRNEIPFARHPTLGTATFVAARLGSVRVVLETGRGPVPVRIARSPGTASRGRSRSINMRNHCMQPPTLGGS